MHREIQTAAPAVTIEDLEDSIRFELLRELRFPDVMAFVSEFYWQRRTILIYAHIGLTTVFFGLWLWLGVSLADGENSLAWLTSWGLGFVGFLVLLPVHEAIHGVVYRLAGAADVRFGIQWRQFVAYATAHQFVADVRQFTWVAIAPFLAITGGLLLAAALLPDYRALLFAVLFWHTSGTSGDFAILNYYQLHRGRELYTYDDADTKTSYFYAAR